MQPNFRTSLLALVLALALLRVQAGSTNALVIHAPSPTEQRRIDPKLFGNFIELLDDVAPGMWAEMLNDRSFEGTGRLANWCYYDGSLDFCDRQWDTNPSWTLDTNNVFNGQPCAKLSCSPRNPASLTQSSLAIKRAMTYEFSGHFRADNPKLTLTVLLKSRLPNGEWMTLASAKLPALSSEWMKRSVRMTSKGGTDRVVFELRAEGRGNVWADKLSLMPADNLNGWRRDVVETIKDVRPSLVRFGGSVCDPGGYRWKNGIGDRDLRVPFPNRVWGRLDPNDVGIDEFCQFCELTGVEPLICLSFSDGAQSAADLVEYCNGDTHTTWGSKRAANGHPAPYRVKYWQIGNEISGDNESYLAQFGSFVESMKRVDSRILILSSFPTQKLLDRFGAQIDFVAPHHYTPDMAFGEHDFSQLTDMLARTPGCSHIQIAVTEWNSSAGDWGLGRGRQQTLENALINARYLNVMMRHSDKVKIACRSNMANSFCGAIIETSLAGILKRPSYYVMHLYAHHAKPVPLRIKQTAAGLDVFACASENGTSATIFAVNPTKEPVECSCNFEGFHGVMHPIKTESVCDTLDARQTDVMNHWETPKRINIVPLKVTPERIVFPALSVTAVDCEIN